MPVAEASLVALASLNGAPETSPSSLTTTAADTSAIVALELTLAEIPPR